MEPDSVEEDQPDIPAVVVLLMSSFGSSLIPGHFYVSNAIQKCMLLRECYNLDLRRSEKEGWSEVSIAMICESDR